jgi:pyruvate/2-oxoglutarate dehydrogenase complex dihydrolipoamide acyltransferase (E2) component
MSASKAQVGEQVSAGDVIGLIGSTGRSTAPAPPFRGPHQLIARSTRARSWSPPRMFSKKPEPSYPSAAPRPAARPMANGSTFSVIGADVAIKGNDEASADLHVDGVVEGDLVCTSLVQGESSRVEAASPPDSARPCRNDQVAPSPSRELVSSRARGSTATCTTRR